MNSITFWNTLSASIIGIIIYPIIQLILTGHPLYILMIMGILVTDLITRFLKWISRYSNNKLLKRPVDATNCDILCQNGMQGNSPGMPSGHMALALFFVTFLYVIQMHSLDSVVHKALFVVVAIVYTSLMGYDRVRRKCHTLSQVLSGTALGSILGVSISLIFKSKL
jgi:membrane-associated phospholipid phosphatase